MSIADNTTVLCKHNAIHGHDRKYPCQPFRPLHRDPDRRHQKMPLPDVDFGVNAIEFEDSRDFQKIKRIGCIVGKLGMLVSRLHSDIPISNYDLQPRDSTVEDAITVGGAFTDLSCEGFSDKVARKVHDNRRSEFLPAKLLRIFRPCWHSAPRERSSVPCRLGTCCLACRC